MPDTNSTQKAKKAVKTKVQPAKTAVKRKSEKQLKKTAEEPAVEVVVSQDGQLSQDQTRKAIIALLKHLEKKDSEESNSDKSKKRKLNLLSDDPSDPKELDKKALFLVLGTKKFLSDKLVMKPKRITIPHPIYSAENTSICLITKDPQRLYKDVLLVDEESPVKDSIARIVGVSKLKTKFKTYEARRQLRDEHDLFLADERIVPLMPALLGKSFISVKKLPIAISLLSPSSTTVVKTKDGERPKRKAETTPEEELAKEKAAISTKRISSEIKRTLNSTMVVLPAGNCTTIKFGYSSFAVDDLVENVTALVEGLTKSVVKGGWSGIRSLNVKTRDSISLPIYLTDKLE